MAKKSEKRLGAWERYLVCRQMRFVFLPGNSTFDPMQQRAEERDSFLQTSSSVASDPLDLILEGKVMRLVAHVIFTQYQD